MLKQAACVVAIHPVTGEVLAATRRGSDDDWGIIGGKRDPGEDYEYTAIREFFEETGHKLAYRPKFIGMFKDEEDWDIAVYVVMAHSDLLQLAHKFNGGPFEIEEPNEAGSIKVGFVPYGKLIVKTFAQFNIDLIGPLMLALKDGYRS